MRAGPHNPISGGLRADCHGEACHRLGSCREAACTLDAVEIRDGHLELRSARNVTQGRNFTTGAVNTFNTAHWRASEGTFRVCIAAVLPGVTGHAAGVWPAYWMLPADNTCDPDEGEIDLMEMVNGDGISYSTYHWQTGYPATKCECPGEEEHDARTLRGCHPMPMPACPPARVCLCMYRCAFPKDHLSNYTNASLPAGWNATQHEWAVELGTSHVAFALDGKVMLNVTAPYTKFWDVPWYLILNTAIGGSWPGSPTDATALPIVHKIDYVRVARQASMGQARR